MGTRTGPAPPNPRSHNQGNDMPAESKKTKAKSGAQKAAEAKALKKAQAVAKKKTVEKTAATGKKTTTPARERAAVKTVKAAKLAKTKPRAAAKPRTITPSPARGRSTRKANDPRIVLADDTAELSAHKFDIELNDLAPEADPSPRFELPEYEDLGDLPSIYGTRKLFLAARDPHWLYAYWDLSHAQLSEGERAAHDGKLFLQLYNGGGSRLQQIQISPWSHDWYLHATPNAPYYVEIGYYRHDGGFEVLAKSPVIETPPDSISWKTDCRFVTIPFHFSFRQLMELVQAHRREGEELAETLARLQEEGFPFPFDVRRPAGMSEENYAELLSALGAVTLRRIQQGSGEIIEMLRKNLLTQLSSGQWVTSISSPFGASFGAAGERGFFMDVNAELIIYGGTHPQAKVRIDGERIQLTPDGRFSYHFNFKDGKFHIPIEAESPDGVEMRSALLSFLRMTALDPGVEPTPQAPRPTPMGEVE